MYWSCKNKTIQRWIARCEAEEVEGGFLQEKNCVYSAEFKGAVVIDYRVKTLKAQLRIDISVK